MHLAAVTTADKWHDDAHFGLRQLEQLRQLRAYRGWILRRGVDNQLSGRLPVSHGGMRFNMGMLDLLRCIGILEDLIRFGKTNSNIAVGYMINAQNIAV